MNIFKKLFEKNKKKKEFLDAFKISEVTVRENTMRMVAEHPDLVKVMLPFADMLCSTKGAFNYCGFSMFSHKHGELIHVEIRRDGGISAAEKVKILEGLLTRNGIEIPKIGLDKEMKEQ